IVALLQERLERLESNARRVLRAASVFGESFWQGGVEALVGTADAPSVSAWLEELTRRDLVQRKATSRFDGEAELGFRHALVRDAAYASLTDADLLVGHRLAANWLETHGEPEPASIARHYALGQEPLQAARHWTRAAALAFEHNDLPKALDLVRRVEATGLPTDPAERAAFDAIAFKAGYWSGQLQSTIQRAEKALGSAQFGTPAWHELAVLFLRASATEQDPRMSRILEDLSAALEKDPALRRPTEALGEVTMALLRDGDRERAERTITLFGGEGTAPLARAYGARAKSWVAMFDGDVSACIQLDRDAAEAFEAAGHRREALAAHGALAYDWMLVGEWEKARDGFARIAEKAQAGGMEFIAHNARHNLGFVLLRLGDAEKCVEIQRHSINTATEERKVVVKYSYSYLSKALEALGRFDEAIEAAEKAREGDTFISVEAMAATLGSRAARARGDFDRSLELAAKAKALLEERGVLEEGEQEVRNEWAKALLAAGRLDEAREAARLARDAVLDKAKKLQDEATRASFVSRIPEHREALDLAEHLLSEESPGEGRA
ncbi:MAG: tetratricopeptide repeat protein, partial [Polyangiaceae bacterium]|nr:tetratricopeptide repeat protein [Polyangiaceae bacterium]